MASMACSDDRERLIGINAIRYTHSHIERTRLPVVVLGKGVVVEVISPVCKTVSVRMTLDTSDKIIHTAYTKKNDK